VSSKLGRPSGRPNPRSASVGHPGASSEKGEPVFSSSPRTPLLHNGVWVRWPIDADAPWKSHGRLRGTARTNPSTAFPPSFEKRLNGCRFSTAPTGRRRSVEERSLGLSLHSEPSAWLGDSTKARLHSTLFQPSGCPIDGVHLMLQRNPARCKSEACQLRRAGVKPSPPRRGSAEAIEDQPPPDAHGDNRTRCGPAAESALEAATPIYGMVRQLG